LHFDWRDRSRSLLKITKFFAGATLAWDNVGPALWRPDVGGIPIRGSSIVAFSTFRGALNFSIRRGTDQFGTSPIGLAALK
jgi:hypothetical protein